MPVEFVSSTHRWKVLRPLRGGAQGDVFLVADSALRDRQFVVKRLKADRATNPLRPAGTQEKRFRLEVEALRSLGNAGCPNIVQVIDHDLAPADGAQPWFVMPFYRAGAMYRGKREGQPHYLEQYQGNLARPLFVVHQVALALKFMHEMSPGYLHRDVKCGNIFFDAPGEAPILGDFGLVHTDNPLPTPDTAAQDRIGPGLWRPPEYRRGGSDKRHPGSDIYLLGGVLYEALTGGEWIDEIEHVGSHFTHERPEFSIARFTDDPRIEWVNRLLRGMFRRDPDQRLSAADVVDICTQLLAWTAGAPGPDIQPAIDEAEQAAAEYRVRSINIRDETIRRELQTICDSVAEHFNSRGWAPINHVTKAIDTNYGDTEPLTAMRRSYPGSVWMAARVTVGFETATERPHFMSYIFVGRTAANQEIVGIYDEDRSWRILTEGPPNSPAHYDLVLRSAASERDRLLKKLAPKIRELR
jgi:serine/threonine protein kinase